MDSSASTSQCCASVVRKRGRPAGRNRVPLSLEERRARNAEYERERRAEIGVAVTKLGAAISSGTSSMQDLIAETLISLRAFKERRKAWSSGADEILSVNKELLSEVKALKRSLGVEPEPDDVASVPLKRRLDDDDDECSHPFSKRLALDSECRSETVTSAPPPAHESPACPHWSGDPAAWSESPHSASDSSESFPVPGPCEKGAQCSRPDVDTSLFQQPVNLSLSELISIYL